MRCIKRISDVIPPDVMELRLALNRRDESLITRILNLRAKCARLEIEASTGCASLRITRELLTRWNHALHGNGPYTVREVGQQLADELYAQAVLVDHNSENHK